MVRRTGPSEDSTDQPAARRLVSRRGVIGGAGAAVAAALVANAHPASADTGDALILGALNVSSTPTGLQLLNGSGPAFEVGSNSGPAISARLTRGSHVGPEALTITAAIDGIVNGSAGATAIGVLGQSASDRGLTATAMDWDLKGRPSAATGVVGISSADGSVTITATAINAGLAGYADPRSNGSDAIGVFGQAGRSAAHPTVTAGLFGLGGELGVIGASQVSDSWPWAATLTAGVLGVSGGANPGVVGGSTSGVGVRGVASGASPAVEAVGPFALSVEGTTRFSRSGATTIAYPAKTAVISVPGGISSTSKGFAVAQSEVAGVWVTSVAATPDGTNGPGKLTITLKKPPGTLRAPRSVSVAWYVLD